MVALLIVLGAEMAASANDALNGNAATPATSPASATTKLGTRIRLSFTYRSSRGDRQRTRSLLPIETGVPVYLFRPDSRRPSRRLIRIFSANEAKSSLRAI